MSFWADACNSAVNRPPQTLLVSAYASCGVTVRCAAAACVALWVCIARARLSVAGDAFAAQIAAFCASALAGGTMFLRWRRMRGEGRRGEWELYGWFSGLMLCGSCFGAVAWAAEMHAIVLTFNVYNNSSSTLTKAQALSILAQAYRWAAAFVVAYATEFLCLCAAKLMVLDRMMEFAVRKGQGVWRRWVVGGRVVMAAVVAGNVVGLGGNVAAAVYFQRSAESLSAASAAFAANNTADGNNFVNLAVQQQQLAFSTQSLQSFCEVAVLLLIIVAFAVAGAACTRRISSALLDTNFAPAAAAAKQLRLRIVGTTAFVFVTFLLRAVHSTMFALANELQNDGVDCPSSNPCDASCFNVYKLMQLWLIYTPEFQLIVVLISSPLALLVALLGMTTDRALRQMQSNRRQMGAIRGRGEAGLPPNPTPLIPPHPTPLP
jgi:hypothetical protein